MGVHNLKTKDEFDSAKSESGIYVIDFFATWCGPCKAIAPAVVGMSDTFPSVRFYKLDVDELPEISKDLGIRAMPTFLVFKGEEKVAEVVALPPFLLSITCHPPPHPTSAILHTSPSFPAHVIDIPLSLALAQHLPSQLSPYRHPTLRHPLSAPAPTSPYPSTEPKSDKARQRVIERLGDDGKAVIDEAWIREGLEEVRKSLRGGHEQGLERRWCLERSVVPGLEDGGRGAEKKKRKRERRTAGHECEGKDGIEEDANARASTSEDMLSSGMTMDKAIAWPAGLESEMEPCLRSSSIGEHSWEAAKQDSNPLVLPAEETSPGEHLVVKEVGNRLVSSRSESRYLLTLPVSRKMDSHSPSYTLPPFSSFMLSNINSESIKTFSQSVYNMLPKSSKSAGPGQFDFVLLDPPWANRSVRRSRKYGTIESRGEETDPLIHLEGMLGQHIGPKGLVGCWITNKITVREKALRLFESWAVDLVEEWVWLKVTTQGEPVTELGGLWRKPYEVLLLGKKALKNELGQTLDRTVGAEDKVIKKKLIIAVPDFHSRKPNLKELIEPMLPDPKNCRALEVFARNMTATWWAWGDECLKYNWTGFWSNNQSVLVQPDR
ncbi:hypothetical protein G7Y79_00022g052060 [Physcia stellaris]|nr:hypothetical protein G7Y79_00022g052060 [Physcia stellaris]